MIKKLLIIIIILSGILFTSNMQVSANVLSDEDINNIYTVTLFDGTFLFERSNVIVGDIYVDNQFDEYIVVSVNENEKTAKAKFNQRLSPPKVSFNLVNPSPIDTLNKKIAMYSTHNDESYVTGDGYDSVYGKGGIHDVANKLKNEFKLKGIDTTYDETLHIPHDTYAYSRSSSTAKKLIEQNPNAIFDIHRDGASRKTYVSTYNGQEVCKIRMVIGKSNANYKVNQEFALYLMSVAKEIHPWLFLDIYFGQGHYNQALSSKAILFEMGSHLVEKSLVLKSVEPLAEVINIALFGTVVEENGDAVIGGNSDQNPTIDEYFQIKDENLKNTNYNTILWGVMTTVGIIIIVGGVFLILNKTKILIKDKN